MRQSSLLLLGTLIASIYTPLARADQPVNCLRQQIHDQVWNFHVSKDQDVVNLFETKEVCTHQLPNRVQVLTSETQWKFDREDVWQIMIRPDFTADATFCKDGNTKACDKNSLKGTWQNYYDQSMLVTLDNNLEFLANFRYELKSNITKEPSKHLKQLGNLITDIEESAKVNFDSICNQTMVGFVNNKNNTNTMTQHQVTCFYAEKDFSQLYEDQIATSIPSGGNLEEDNISYLQTKIEIDKQLQFEASDRQQMAQQQNNVRNRGKKGNRFQDFQKSDEMDLYINYINDNQAHFSWEANTCLLQEHHVKYNKLECEGEVTLLQEGEQEGEVCLAQVDADSVRYHLLKKMDPTLGISPTKEEGGKKTSKKEPHQPRKHKKNSLSGKKTFGDKTQEFEDAVIKAQRWKQKYKNIEEIPDEVVPKTYDFRNIDEFDFTGPVRDQVECGSCYTLGFIQALEARLKLKYAHKADIPQLSVQFFLECNYLNEGCDGGWAIFNGFLAQNGHLVTEECAPYRAKTKGFKCSDYSHCPGFATVKDSYYVGGYNFPPTEKMMQKEMLMNGPLVAEFKCDDSFQVYKSGILKQDANPNLNKTKLVESPKSVYVPFEGEFQLQQTQAEVESQTMAQTYTKMAEQALDHTIFIIGWGIDKDTNENYWIVRNSYGDKWGMRGDFHVRRGFNDYGIESELSGYNVELM